MAEIGYWASFVAGAILLLFSLLGLRAFVPRIFNSSTMASRTLAMAIVFGFASVGLNTAYWQIFGQVGQWVGIVTLPTVRLYGSYLDVLFKGGGAVAVYLHLAASLYSLDDDERRRWTVLGMATYPDGKGLLARLLNGMWRAK